MTTTGTQHNAHAPMSAELYAGPGKGNRVQATDRHPHLEPNWKERARQIGQMVHRIKVH